MPHHIGYKKLAKNRIATLLIEGINNEHRNGVTRRSRKYAKHRCQKATVLEITNLKGDKTYRTGSSMPNWFYPSRRLTYRRGKSINIDNYNQNLNRVCSTGIHYFLDREVAVMYGTLPSNHTGHIKEYTHNGELVVEYDMINGIVQDDSIIKYF